VPFGPDPVFRLSHPLALPPTTHYHDQCICLHPASRGSSHRHGQSPSSFEVLGTSRHAVYGFRVAGISTLRPASEHWLLLVFQRCQLRMQLQRLHVSRGRFRETPLNVINHDQHIQSRSPTEPDESEKLSGIVPKNVPGKRLTTTFGQSDGLS
jgi:hypothetical protein